MLEFYTGVIFLTTNRVGVLDDAIKSRITWTAYYPPLDAQQTQKIWKINLRLLQERKKRLQVDKKGILKFAREHFRSGVAKDSTWNGRQIQNAFKVATALAEWDAYSTTVQQDIHTSITPAEDATRSQPKLLASHFETIATGTDAFDEYLKAATGYSEGQRAYNSMERADDFDVPAQDTDTYAGGNIPAFSGEHDRNHRHPSFSSSSTFKWPRNSSPFTVSASPKGQSHGRDSGSSQTTRRKDSVQREHQPFFSLSPGQQLNTFNLHPPPAHSNSQRQQNAAATPATIHSSKAQDRSSRDRNISNPFMAQRTHNSDDEQNGNAIGSSDNDDEPGGVFPNVEEESDEDDDEIW